MTTGPIRALRFIHTAIRAQATEIESRCATMERPSEAAAIARAVGLLGKAIRGHAQGEERGYFPALTERARAWVEPFTAEHEQESQRLDQLEQLVLGCRTEPQLASLKRLSAEVRHGLDEHMTREEEILWPLTEARFTPGEQAEMIQAILREVPKADLPELVAWIVEMQPASEAVAYLRMLQQAQPPEVFATSVGWIRERVPERRWSELTRAIPEL